MLSLAVAYTLFNAQVDPPRLRTLLPNGSAILVEPMPKEKVVSVQLWASARGVEERPETHGIRHLLEHVLALGRNRDLDQRLETVGGFLRARTFRDATQIEVQVPQGQMSLGLSAVKELLAPLQLTQDEVSRETQVIEQELALLDDADRLNAAGWDRAYGDFALDPFGDLEVLKAATPADVEAIRRKQFAAPKLVVVVTGPVSLDGTTRLVRDILGSLPKAEAAEPKHRSTGLPSQVQADAFGETRAAMVPEFSSKQAMAALAAALAIGSKLDDCYVTYTPSVEPGLVLLGRTEAKEGLGAFIDALDEATAGALFNRGKTLAMGWVQRQMSSASGVGYLRGLLLAQGAGNRPEMMQETIQSLTLKDFLGGVAALKRGKAISVVGDQ